MVGQVEQHMFLHKARHRTTGLIRFAHSRSDRWRSHLCTSSHMSSQVQFGIRVVPAASRPSWPSDKTFVALSSVRPRMNQARQDGDEHVSDSRPELFRLVPNFLFGIPKQPVGSCFVRHLSFPRTYFACLDWFKEWIQSQTISVGDFCWIQHAYI